MGDCGGDGSNGLILSTDPQLLMLVAVSGTAIQSSSPMNLLPSASSVINMADSQERAIFAKVMHIKEESMDVELVDPPSEVKEVSYRVLYVCGCCIVCIRCR